MRRILTAVLCALLFSACLTTDLWHWASDTHPGSPTPVSCGEDTDGSTVILVAVDGDEDPSFCLRVPADWRARTAVPVVATSNTIRSPLYLSRAPVPQGVPAGLTPAPDEWFLSHNLESTSFDILVGSGSDYVVVGTAELPSKVHWEKRIAAVVLTPAAVAFDVVAAILAITVKTGISPWTWGDHDHEGASGNDSPAEQPSGLIHPAHGPS